MSHTVHIKTTDIKLTHNMNPNHQESMGRKFLFAQMYETHLTFTYNLSIQTDLCDDLVKFTHI